MMVEVVKQYGNEIPKIIKSIKEKHIENDDKEKAEMIFSTVHRSKGMEYDAVQIVDDFITEEKLEKANVEGKEGEQNKAKLAEEINLLYVAITRAKSVIHIPEALMPFNFPKSPQIHVISTPPEEDRKGEVSVGGLKRGGVSLGDTHQKSYTVEEVRAGHKDAYKPWSAELDEELTVMYCEGVNVKNLAAHFGRTRGAIRSRIKKLELQEFYG